jgi:hypothetical protein
MTKELLEKPAKVILAVKFLYLVIGTGIIRTSMTVIRHADVRSPDFLIFTKFMVYAVSLFLIYQMAKGKNWARWSLIVIFVISIPLAILPTFDSMTHNPVHSILGFLQLGLYVAAMLFLFHESSSGWFGARKPSKAS